MAPIPIDTLSERPVVAVSGIGNNDAFARTLADAGAQVAEHLAYPDHHAFTGEDVAWIRAAAKAVPESRIVTTAKDAPRLSAVAPELRYCALHVEMDLGAGAEGLRESLRRVLADVRP